LQGGEKSTSSTACSKTSAELEMHDASGDDISDNSFSEGDSGEAYCNTDNDMMDGLPTASSNSANDASRLDFSEAVQLKKSG